MANLDHGGQDGMVRMDYELNFGLLLLRYSLINTSYIQIVIDLLLNLLSYASLAVILKKLSVQLSRTSPGPSRPRT